MLKTVCQSVTWFKRYKTLKSVTVGSLNLRKFSYSARTRSAFGLARNEVVKAYGFGPKFQRWMSIFYPSGAHSARINVNNFLSLQFKIERGIRHGCPLSCLVWLLCMEPLLKKNPDE